MDDILFSEIVLVALEREEGVPYEEFDELFYQVHGYYLKLEIHGYKSFEDLLVAMKGLVELRNVNGKQLIRYREPRRQNVIAPSPENDLYMPEPCTASSSVGSAMQSTMPPQNYVTSVACSAKDQGLTRLQVPLQEIAEIISQKIKNHKRGLRAEKLRQYILEKHKIDLEMYSKELGYTDMLSMLKQIPDITFPNISGKNIIIAACFYNDLSEDQHAPSANTGLSNAAPSSTSESTPPANHTAQPEVSSNEKKVIQESSGAADPSQKHDFITSQAAPLHQTGSKPDHLFTGRDNQTISSQDPTIRILKETPCTGFSDDSKQNVLIPLASLDKAYISKPSQPKTEPFPLGKVIGVLRMFPLGLKVKTLKKHILNTHGGDLDVICQKLGYADIPSMLQNVPGITCLKNDVFIASDTQKSEEQPVQNQKAPFSEQILLTILKLFPSGVLVNNLIKLVKQIYKTDLLIYSHEKGFTDTISLLESISGVTVVNKNVVFDSEVFKKFITTCENTAAKHSVNAGTEVSNIQAPIKTLENVTWPSATKPAGTGQQIGLPAQQSMLKQAPMIASPKGNVVASEAPKSTKGQPVPVQKVQFSEKRMVDHLKQFPSGLKVQKLSKHMKKKYKTDLMTYSQKKGFTDMIDLLQSISGVTVVNKDVIIATEIYKNCNATCKSAPGKHLINAVTRVSKNIPVPIKTPLGSHTVTKTSTTRSTGTGQKISQPTHQVPSTNATNTVLQNMQPGIRPNVSYASACLSNLRKDQSNTHVPQCPPTFNVQKAYTAKPTSPNPKEVPKSVLPNSKAKENLRLLLKSYPKGLSIFQLKKLYLLKFEQPLVRKGLTARKLLLGMKDVAIIKGVGVQMKVFPVNLQDSSTSTNINKDCTLQGVTASVPKAGKNNETLIDPQVLTPLSVINSTEHPTQTIPLLLSRHQPSSSGFNHTNIPGGRIPISSSEEIHTQPFYQNQPMTNNPSVLGSGHISEAQWPSLPQKLTILKKTKQGSKVSDQLQKIIKNNDLCFKQNPTATAQPQLKGNIAQTSMHARQDPNQTNDNVDYRQEPNVAQPRLESGFSFVFDEPGFCFVKEEPKVEKDKKSLEKSLTRPPQEPITEAAHGVFDHSGVNTRKIINDTPLQVNQSAHCNIATQNKGCAPKAANGKSEVQKVANLSTKKVPQQTKNHQLTSGTTSSVLNQKSNDSQSQQIPNNLHAFSPTGFTSLTTQNTKPICASGQHSPSKGQQEASGSKSTINNDRQVSSPASSLSGEQTTGNSRPVSSSVLNLSMAQTVSHGTQLPTPAPNLSEGKTTSKGKQASSPVSNLSSLQNTSKGQHILSPVSSLSGAETTSSNVRVSFPASNPSGAEIPSNGESLSSTALIEQNVQSNCTQNTKIFTISEILQKTIDHNIVNGQLCFKTSDLLTSPRAVTGHGFTHEKTVTGAYHTPGSSAEQSRSFSQTHQYSGQDKDSSESHHHSSNLVHHFTPDLTENPSTPCDQQDSSHLQAEDSANTWQNNSKQTCCIL